MTWNPVKSEKITRNVETPSSPSDFYLALQFSYPEANIRLNFTPKKSLFVSSLPVVFITFREIRSQEPWTELHCIFGYVILKYETPADNGLCGDQSVTNFWFQIISFAFLLNLNLASRERNSAWCFCNNGWVIKETIMIWGD